MAVDNASRVAQQEVKQRVCAVNRHLLQSFASSFGPRGRTHVVQANQQCADALTITSSAGRYLRSVRLGNCSISNTLMHILQGKLYGNNADAGHLMVILATSLQLEVQDGTLSGIPHYVVERGLRLALTWILAFLDDPTCPVKISVDWSNETALHAVIRGVVGAKTSATGLNELELDSHIVSLVLRTFIAVYEYATRFRTEKFPLHFVHLPEVVSTEGCQLLKGVVLLDRQWPVMDITSIASRVAPPLNNVTVALFDVTIEPRSDNSADDDGVSVESADESQSAEFRLAALRQFADTLGKHGVTAVMSQKIIPSYLKTYLLSKSIFSLDRLASSHIRAVQLLSGASLLSDWRLDHAPGELPKTFGYLSLISTEKIGRSKTFIRLERHPDAEDAGIPSAAASADRSWPVSTVVVEASDAFAYEELVECISTALKVLSQLLEEPEVVAGAGCTEIHLAAWLELQASHLVPDEQVRPSTTQMDGAASKAQARTLRQLRTCVRTFARLLKRTAGILCQEQRPSALGALSECDVDSSRIIEQLDSKNRPRFGWEYALQENATQCALFGWNATLDQVDEVLAYEWRDHEKIVTEAKVLDSLQCKRDAIVYAVECALVLMRIGSVVKVQ